MGRKRQLTSSWSVQMRVVTRSESTPSLTACLVPEQTLSIGAIDSGVCAHGWICAPPREHKLFTRIFLVLHVTLCFLCPCHRCCLDKIKSCSWSFVSSPPAWICFARMLSSLLQPLHSLHEYSV